MAALMGVAERSDEGGVKDLSSASDLCCMFDGSCEFSLLLFSVRKLYHDAMLNVKTDSIKWPV